ncbi:MAG: hypothetical protein N4A31_01485 [Rickettsiales bacterium]|jgi:hypothetical protein|nr:hypothetical protein [Rickettsiales bacterium]
MSTNEENFKAIEAKMLKQKKAWPSKLTQACLDKAIKNIAPILDHSKSQLSSKSRPPKLPDKPSRTRG